MRIEEILSICFVIIMPVFFGFVIKGFFKSLSWNPSQYSDQENWQWCYLRAIEWKVWPAFITQPIIPVLFIFFPWYMVLISILSLSWLWAFVRHRSVNVDLADLGPLFVKLKWITIPIAVIYLTYNGHYVLAVVALFWSLIASFIGFVPGGMTGKIQDMFIMRLAEEYQ